MHAIHILSLARKILGLAMILTGIFGTVAQLAKGHTLRKDFGEGVAYAVASQAGADMPRVENAKAETRPVAGTLEATFRGILAQAENPEWVGYSVDQVAGDRGLGQGALTAIALHADSSADRMLQTFVASDQPEELRRQTAFWLGEARGKAGLDALRQMAKSDPNSDVRAHVTFALSVSHESGAIEEMIRMAHDDSSSHVRGQALFWLAQKAGKKAVGTITGAIENDPDTDVKKKAVFALSQLPKDEGVPKLIEVAQTNRNPEVRKQAMFWLGQSNDPRPLEFFEKVLTK